jgi:adenylate cyclase
MKAVLEYRSEGVKTEAILTKPLISLGRGDSSDVVFADPRASRSHALLRGTGEDKYYLIDLGSKNGTYVNGKRVVVPVLLKNGDEIRMGETNLTYLLSGGAKEIPEETPTVPPIDVEMVQSTVLAADIVGYRAMSEQLPLNSLARLMGNWFTYANNIIEKNNGDLDKFTGAAVMARWLSNSNDLQDTIRRAFKTAYDLLKMTHELSQGYPFLSDPLQIGVGIITAGATATDPGSHRPEDYTAMIGSANLALSLGKSAKKLKGDVAVGYRTFELLQETSLKGCEKAIRMKGKDQPVRICLLQFDELAQVLSLL